MQLKVAPGAPHDDAAIQEGLFGTSSLAGAEQTELLPLTAGVPVARLADSKLTAPDMPRVRREGEEPEGLRPLPLIPEA